MYIKICRIFRHVEVCHFAFGKNFLPGNMLVQGGIGLYSGFPLQMLKRRENLSFFPAHAAEDQMA